MSDDIENLITAQASAPPAPTLAIKDTQANRLLLLESRVGGLERLIREGFEKLSRPQAPAQVEAPRQSAVGPLAEMAAAWSMFNTMQAQAQQQVQANYDFTRKLAQDIAEKGAPAEPDGLGSIITALPQLLPLLQQAQAPAASPIPAPSPAPPTPSPSPAPEVEA